MNTINKVALCNNLNMNFDEASELFSEESLQSMQMAKISGKGLPTWASDLLARTNYSSYYSLCSDFKYKRITPFGTAGIINPTAPTLPEDYYIEVGGDDIFKIFNGGSFFTWSLSSGFVDSGSSSSGSGSTIPTPTSN